MCNVDLLDMNLTDLKEMDFLTSPYVPHQKRFCTEKEKYSFFQNNENSFVKYQNFDVESNLSIANEEFNSLEDFDQA